MRESDCAMTVATAAPRMPMSNPKMKIGSKMVFTTTVAMVAYMEALGCPDARSNAFMPK